MLEVAAACTPLVASLAPWSSSVAAAAAPAAAAAAKLGPPPVPCSGAPCQQPGSPVLKGPGGATLLAQSSVVHLTITPHVIGADQVIRMQVTYSGTGHCDPKQSDCGPMMCHPFDDQLIAFLKAYAGSQKPGALPGQGQEKIVHVTTLKLYESSFCTGMDCRPGDIARPAATVSGAGVHFNLFFAFSFADAADPNLDKYFDTFNVSTGYIAPEWIVAQCDGAGADPSLHVRGGCVDRSGGEPQPGPSE